MIRIERAAWRQAPPADCWRWLLSCPVSVEAPETQAAAGYRDGVVVTGPDASGHHLVDAEATASRRAARPANPNVARYDFGPERRAAGA